MLLRHQPGHLLYRGAAIATGQSPAMGMRRLMDLFAPRETAEADRIGIATRMRIVRIDGLWKLNPNPNPKILRPAAPSQWLR